MVEFGLDLMAPGYMGDPHYMHGIETAVGYYIIDENKKFILKC